MFSKHLIGQRLVADMSAARFPAERLENARVDARIGIEPDAAA
jgi:hypothetical protein